MPDRTTAILSGNENIVYERMLHDCHLLESCGSCCIAIPCNTSHYFADRLQKEISIPIIHMPRETVKRLAQTNHKKVAILATDGTIMTGVYRREIEAEGMQAWQPDAETQKKVMSLIYDEIKRGEKGNRHSFAAIDKAVRDAGCDCAILGCTELSVYREYHGLPSFYIDAMEVLAEECIRFFDREPLHV